MMYYYPFALHKDKQIDHKYLVYYYILAKKIHEFKIFKQVQKKKMYGIVVHFFLKFSESKYRSSKKVLHSLSK